MGNFAVALVLLSIVIIFTGVNSVVICNICDDIIRLIDENKLEEACRKWEENYEYIAIFVRDAEIDVVNAEAKELKEGIPYEDAEAEAGKIKFRDSVLEIIYSEKPSFQDIF